MSRCPGAKSLTKCCEAQFSRDTKMTATKIVNMVDRLALSLMNALVVVGLPLAAVGILTQSL